MDFSSDFNSLSAFHKKQARDLIRKTFLPIMTEHHSLSNGSENYELQLEIISMQAQKILNHRVLFLGYASDKLILNRKLFIHHFTFLREKRLPELGTYERIHLLDYEIWRIGNKLNNQPPQVPCQILHMDAALKKVIDLPEFAPYIPKKLQGLDFDLIEQNEKRKLPQNPDKKGIIDKIG